MTAAIVRVYGLKNCDTCRKARKWLDANGVAHEFIDYREQPIASALLASWARQLGGWDKLVNRASTTWRSLPQEAREPAGDQGWQALIAEHPALVKRPVLVTADGAVGVGFREPVWAERLKG